MTTVIMKTHSGNHESKEAFIAQLLEMFATYPLRRDFEGCVTKGMNPFYDPCPNWVTHGDTHDDEGIKTYYVSPLPYGVWSFGGNFYNYNFAFSVYTDEKEMIEKLRSAIKANRKRPDYLAQPKREPAKYKTVIQGDVVLDWAKPGEKGDQYLTYG